MALPKVFGIETEFGIVFRGVADGNPVVASSMLVNSYVEHRRVGWDFEDESPGRDARGFAREDASPPEVETHLVNTVLTNGARYYVDHAHPEFSSPECTSALQLTRYDKAGERILARSMQAAQRILPPGQEIVVYKNNSDGKGNSYGCHENYLLDRAVPFSTLVRHLIPWFVTRQIFAGAGKVGSEHGAAEARFQLSQRADFFEEEVGLETTLKRPIINTRDEPHADPQKYRRLHVIVGDANLCEVATYLKTATTAAILSHGRGRLHRQGPVAGHTCSLDAQDLPRPVAQGVAAHGRRVHGHRPGAPVGVLPHGREVRGRDRPRIHAVRPTRAPTCCAAGRRSSPPWRRTPAASTASWTGPPSTTCSRPTRIRTGSSPTIPSWP